MIDQHTHNPIRARRGQVRTAIAAGRGARAAGFTLLEVILAMTVTTIISAVLFTSMSAAFKARRHTEDHHAGRDAARAVMATLRTDLQCVPPAGGRIRGVFVGEDESNGGLPADELTYVTANPALRTEQDLADLRQVELRLLESTEEENTYVLARLVTGNLLARTVPDPTLQILARGVVSMDLQFYDGEDWQDEWDSVDRENELPEAVQVELVLAPKLSRAIEDDSEREKTYLTTTQVVRLPVVVGGLEEVEGGGFGLPGF